MILNQGAVPQDPFKADAGWHAILALLGVQTCTHDPQDKPKNSK